MNSLSFHSRQPRRGQALLLAVLIMIFAALLSASFIAVVSVNLNQTARQTDKNRSVVAADAGMNYVTRQLAYSTEGDKWRNELENVPPAPGDADYSFYYTPLEIAQGWARTTPHPGDRNGDGTEIDDERLVLVEARKTGKLELVKSPDPRTVGGQIPDAPTFLSQVKRMPLTAGNEKAGALEITVIGLSTEDPTAYTKRTAYFGGYKNAPIGQTMRVVGNWDFVNNVVPAGEIEAYNTATNVLTLTNTKGVFPDAPFTVMIGDPKTNVGVRALTVLLKSGNALTLASAITPAPKIKNIPIDTLGERVELAANIGAPAQIDYNNDGTLTPTTEDVDFKTSDPSYSPTPIAMPIPTPMPGGVRVNGGLWWEGTVAAEAMGGSKNAFTVTNPIPATFQSSGLMALNGPVSLSGSGFTGTASLVSSATAGFPGTTGWPTAPNDKDRLVSDGRNRLAGTINSDGTREVTEFRPPTLDSGEGVERYRNLTRFSPPAAKSSDAAYNSLLISRYGSGAASDAAPLYGYGQGIYIDNSQDIEKVGAGSPLKAMPQTDFVRMLLNPTAATEKYNRSAAPALITDPNVSLEEQHLRGWVGPDEFRARGVDVQLGNDNAFVNSVKNPSGAVLRVTRDARDDGANARGPSPTKTWSDPQGNQISGVYTQTLAWPQNGSLFAEGNVRIHGTALDPPSSLTVISMGNIYIEDSLQLSRPAAPPLNYRDKKIFLGAKKNVVMNPTRALGRPDAQTLTDASTVAPTVVGAFVDLNVRDVSDFRQGDVIETATGTNVTSVGQITNIVTATAPQIRIFVLATGGAPITPQSSVRIRPEQDPIAASTTPYKGINTPGDALQRRFNLPNGSSTLQLSFDQGANRIKAMSVTTKDLDTTNKKPASGIFLSNKRMQVNGDFSSAATNIVQDNKLIRGDYSSPTTGTDPFPAAAMPPTTLTEVTARAINLLAVKVEMETPNPNHVDVVNQIGWDYVVTPEAAYNSMPFFYLAGVGNRYDYGVSPPTALTADPKAGWRAKIDKSDIASPGNIYEMPLATSIGLRLNGSTNPLTMSNEYWNGTSYEQTSAFGFSPNFLTPSPDVQEDVLTVDQSFYQTAPERSTLDSRSFTATLPVGQNSFMLRQNGTDLTSNLPITFQLPEYRLLGIKMDNVTVTPPVAMAGPSTTTNINPGYTFNVNAFVYAQNGSWLVIPGGYFEGRLKTKVNAATPTLLDTFFDVNNNGNFDPGESLDDGTGNTYPDLNRNGVIEDAERYAMARYSRYNYAINFTGAIAENHTALVNDAGTTVKGAVANWMDKWATTTFVSTPTPTITNSRIKYIFDPTVVLNNFQQDDISTTMVDETDYGFHLPQSAEVFGVS